jgi:carboxyl-terminal processing protease
MKDREKASKEFEALFDNKINKGVTNLQADMPTILADESKKVRNDDFLSSVAKDVYIQETLQIMHDLIHIK